MRTTYAKCICQSPSVVPIVPMVTKRSGDNSYSYMYQCTGYHSGNVLNISRDSCIRQTLHQAVGNIAGREPLGTLARYNPCYHIIEAYC